MPLNVEFYLSCSHDTTIKTVTVFSSRLPEFAFSLTCVAIGLVLSVVSYTIELINVY